MKANDNLPLYSNTRLDWLEVLAKLIIEKYSNIKISKLEIIDKPDLQDFLSSVGIEVTSSVDCNTQQMIKLYLGLSRNLIRDPEQAKNKIRELGGRIKDGILCHPRRKRNLNNIYIALEKKAEKLNSGNYKLFKKNVLIIFDNNFIKNEEFDVILYKFIEIRKMYNIFFDYIYLCMFGKELIEFDLILKSINHTLIDDYIELGIKAKKIVINEKIKNEK